MMTLVRFAIATCLLIAGLPLPSLAEVPGGIPTMGLPEAFASADVVAFVQVVAGREDGPVYRVKVLNPIKGMPAQKEWDLPPELLIAPLNCRALWIGHEYLVFLWKVPDPSYRDRLAICLGANVQSPWYEIRVLAPFPICVCGADPPPNCVNKSELLTTLKALLPGK
jgi:hypothetical protein